MLGIGQSPTKEAGAKGWLWTFVAPDYTFCALRPTRSATVLENLLTDALVGVVNCDRAKMYRNGGRPQWYWAFQYLAANFRAHFAAQPAPSRLTRA